MASKVPTCERCGLAPRVARGLCFYCDRRKRKLKAARGAESARQEKIRSR